MLEILFDIVAEIILGFLVEFSVEIAARFFGGKKDVDEESTLITLVYLIIAVVLGWLSVIVYPNSVIEEGPLRIMYFVFVPLAIGGLMSLRGKRLEHKGKTLIKIDSFIYGYLFALFFIITRYMLQT